MAGPEQEPKLKPPGAGVPWYEFLMLRFYYKPFVAERAPWEQSTEGFAKITARMEKEIEGLTPEQLTKKILIPPMSGLEDSSRYWSAAMTLEHLVIVGRGMIGVVRNLSEGRVPPGKASTATVKPSGKFKPEDAVSAFRQFANVEFPALLPSLKNRDSKTTFGHPWLGQTTARGWYWLLAAHHAVHLKQLREITKGLKKCA